MGAKRTKAYRDGYADGLVWDLDGFCTRAEVRATPDGWDSAALNAGEARCARAWGVPLSGPRWDRACREYNEGAYDGACAPQELRTGKPPREVSDAA